ncbi:MAG: FKBP-type peptidyl-prolyl cis-trans isomerase [Planctomycetota bacterium]
MSKRLILAIALPALCLSLSPVARAQDEAATQPSTAIDTIGYFLGFSVGSQMKDNGFASGDFKMESLMKGFQDAFAGKEAALTDEQLLATQQKIQSLLVKRQQERIAAKKAEGVAFLAANAEKEGIKTLKGGVQYKVLKAGDGASPAATDRVKVHYTGRLIDGTVFDSSVQRGTPATFGVNQVIQGWQTALQAMKVGSKWMLYIPSDLAYGERGSQGAIGPNEVLIFEVELLEIQ